MTAADPREGAGVAAADAKSQPVHPVMPQRLVSAVRSATQIELSWTASTEPPPVAGYEVFRDDRLTATVRDPHFIDGGLRPWTRFCYSVRSYDAAGQRSPRTPISCVQTPDEAPPSEPDQLTVTGRGPGEALLAWHASTDDVAVTGYEITRDGKVTATIHETTFVDKVLNAVVEHCYVVRALDAAKNMSPPAGPRCIRLPDLTPPTVPASLQASASGEHTILLTWAAASDDVGVTRYVVERSGPVEPPGSIVVTGTAGRHEGVAAATRHCYAVSACDAAGNCSGPSPQACATTPDLTPPSSPGTPTAAPVSDTAVEIRWGAASDNVGVTGYEVLHRDHVVAAAGPAHAIRIDGLRPAAEYCYALRALDAAGNRSAPSAPACARTPDLHPPTPPGRPAALPVSSTQVFLAWDPSRDDVEVAGYEVYRDARLVAKVTGTRAREHGLEAEHRYCYTVRAYDAAGNRSDDAGPFCTVTTRRDQLAAPSDLRVRRVSPTNILLQWEPSEQRGVVYRIYEQGGHSVGLTAGNTFTPSGRLGAEVSCFRVAAVDEQGRESGKSNEVCAASVDGGSRGG